MINRSRRRARGMGVLGVALASAAFLSACFTANLGGGGTRASAISSALGTKLEMSIRSTDSLGTGLGAAEGALKDIGKNIAFPKGVSLSFKRSVVYGMGEQCDQPDGGPSRAVHAVGLVRGGTSNPCMMWPDPRSWVGLVSYKSNDRSYPNTVNPECSAGFLEYLHSFGGPYSGPIGKPTAAQIAAAPLDDDYLPMSGFGVLVITDTNVSGNPDKGDRFAFTTVCGPFANLPTGFPGSATSKPMDCSGAGIVCTENGGYNYATCPAETFSAPLGGMVPTSWAWAGWGPVLDVLTDPDSGCLQPMRSGDLKIGIAVDIPSTTSSTTSAPLP